MDSFGAMWLDDSRDTQGRSALSVELLYAEDGDGGIAEAAARIEQLLQLGVRVLLRVDARRGQTVPADGDFVGKFHYTHLFARLAAHPVIGQVQGFIVGNEPNLKGENRLGGPGGIPAEWYMKVHSGANASDDDQADVFTQLRSSGYTGDVLIAAIAPWSADTDGTLDFYPTPPGASGTMHWLRYASTLYWLAYNASRLPASDVKGVLHTYSNVLLCQQRELDPALEPTFADGLRNPDWNNCQYGIRVYDEFRQQMDTQAGDAAPVGHYVTEWNSLVGRVNDDLSDPAWPCNNYPVGLLGAAVDYLKDQPNLLGFAVFADRQASGDCPFWQASSARGYLAPAQMDSAQQGRLRDWDAEMDQVFVRGW